VIVGGEFLPNFRAITRKRVTDGEWVSSIQPSTIEVKHLDLILWHVDKLFLSLIPIAIQGSFEKRGVLLKKAGVHKTIFGGSFRTDTNSVTYLLREAAFVRTDIMT